ncbi:MAG: peptide deformylase [Sphingobacteriales bacterium]|jgi:peptide deformylase
MILPIFAYGNPVLKRKADDIPKDHKGIHDLIKNMFNTMDNAKGVGLAGPQVGQSLRIFVVDTTVFDEEEEVLPMRKAFINAQMLDESGKIWPYSEGCLSIPEVREDVSRKSEIKIKYYDENFKEHIEEFDGIPARIIQHEYDHIEGILFTDYLAPLRKRMLKKTLERISKGQIPLDYKMKFNLKLR